MSDDLNIMDEKRNRYILSDEVKILLDRIPEKYKNLKGAIILIYEQGTKINEALEICKFNKTHRTAQNIIKKYSNNLIRFSDLRRSYIYSHPLKLYKIYYSRNDRKQLRPKLRWAVLSRDNFRCVCCGRSSKESILHVDHIIPLSKGGESSMKNLRTLCGECNMGKGVLLLDIVDKNDN